MRIVISGLGVMGASLAMALKNTRENVHIVGFDHADVIRQARQKKIIDEEITEWPQQAAGADLVFLATPVQIIKKHLQQLNTIIDSNTVVTDLGSTKSEIYDFCLRLGFTGTYIGSHPMTGAEKSGLNAANPLLYENAVYILCSQKDKLETEVKEKLIPVLNAIKARIFFLEPHIHDQIMASISHLPQMIAVALMNTVGKHNHKLEHCFDLAAGGFRDLTRIASSSADIWQDIISSNQANIEKSIDDFITQLITEKNNLSNISGEFNKANSYRQRIPKISKGFLSPLTDVLVYVDDQIGVISKISNALFEKNIDIRDIELLKIREKEGGVFMLAFESPQKAAEAVDILNSINYRAFIKE